MSDLGFVLPGDAWDLREAEQRTVTEHLLTNAHDWPLTQLTLKREVPPGEAGDGPGFLIETGHVQRAPLGFWAAPDVFLLNSEEVRRYGTLGDLLDAGWRAD